VAAGALATSLEPQTRVRNPGLGVKPGVALQAELPAFSSHQHHAVGAAVWIVADHAARDPHGWVLVDVRPALLDMTIDARLPVGLIHARAVDAAVRIVAVRAFHQLLGYSVMHGQGKQRLDVAVAAITESGLGLLQQVVVQPAHGVRDLGNLEEGGLRVRKAALALRLDLLDQMRHMTLVAGHTRRYVLGLVEHLLVMACNVAAQAAFRILLRGSVEGEY